MICTEQPQLKKTHAAQLQLHNKQTDRDKQTGQEGTAQGCKQTRRARLPVHRWGAISQSRAEGTVLCALRNRSPSGHNHSQAEKLMTLAAIEAIRPGQAQILQLPYAAGQQMQCLSATCTAVQTSKKWTAVRQLSPNLFGNSQTATSQLN